MAHQSAVLHLYYARLINHFLHSEGLVPTREPFRQLLVQGMVKGTSYRVKDSGKYLKKHEVEKIDNKYVEKETGKSVVTAWEKMSKSKFNGEDPSEMFSQYGIDTTRLLILADVAPTSDRHWSSATFPGVLKWQHRIWILMKQFIKSRNELTSEDLCKIPTGDKFAEEEAYIFDNRNFYLKGVTFNMSRSRQISVGITKLQGLTKSLRKVSLECITRSREYERALAAHIIMLAPMAPHFASELWAGFCSAPHRLVNDGEIQWDKDVLQQNWPQVDLNYKLDLTVKVNNRNLMTLKFPRQMLDKMTSAEALELIAKEPTFQNYLQDRAIINVNLYTHEGCEPTIHIITENTTKQISNENMI